MRGIILLFPAVSNGKKLKARKYLKAEKKKRGRTVPPLTEEDRHKKSWGLKVALEILEERRHLILVSAR